MFHPFDHMIHSFADISILRVDKKHSNCCFKNSETTLVPPFADMTKMVSNVRNLSIGRNFRCYETFRGRRYIVLLETFLKNAFLNTPSYLGCRWFSADRRTLSQCLIESNELSWRAKCTLRESQTQSHTYRARRGLRVECRLNEYWTWSQRMDCGLRGSRERNAIPESGPWYQRAKGSRRERPRNRKSDTVLENRTQSQRA